MNLMPPLPDLAPGKLIGKFRVERVIGEGAMGVVVEATNLDLDERVALKFIRDSHLAGRSVIDRFAREARAAAKLKSEHVARVFDVSSFEGVPFIVMELLEGKDLEQLVAERGPLPIETAVLYVIQACEALAEAHARGIVHRDVKPANVFVVDRPGGWKIAKLLDFGVSKIAPKGWDARGSVRDTGGMVGSPYYMAPEQFRPSNPPKPTGDVWGLGLVLFEILTGKPPFDESHGLAALMTAIAIEPHASIRALRQGLPEGLARVVDHCLEKEPARRCQSAAALATALLPFAPDAAQLPAARARALSGHAARSSSPASPAPVQSVPPPPVTLDRSSEAEPPRAPVPSVGRAASRVALGVVALTCIGLWAERLRHVGAPAAVASSPIAAELETAPATSPPSPTLQADESAAHEDTEHAGHADHAVHQPIEAAPNAAPFASKRVTKVAATRSEPKRKRAGSSLREALAAAVAESEAVDTGAVNSAVRAHASEVQICLEKARPLASVEGLRGKIGVGISFDGSGKVTHSSLVSSTVKSRELEGCLLNVVRTWQLPAPAGRQRDAVSHVTYSFVFR